MVVLKPSADRSRHARSPGNRAALRAWRSIRRSPDFCIGGNAGPFRYRRERMGATAWFSRARSKAWGTRWLVSTSRRTPRSRGRPNRRAGARRERDRPLHRLSHRGARHAAGDIRQLRDDRLHRGFEHHDLRSRLGAASRGRGGAASPSLHRRGADLSDAASSATIGAGCCRSRSLTPKTFAAALSEIEPIKENPLDALAAKLKERLPALF